MECRIKSLEQKWIGAPAEAVPGERRPLQHEKARHSVLTGFFSIRDLRLFK